MQGSFRGAPTATGTLAKTPLAHALVYSRNRRLTGSFELESGRDEQGTIHFWRGRIVSVQTHPVAGHLGTIAYQLGWIDGPTYEASLAAALGDRDQSIDVLVRSGALTPAQRGAAILELVCRQVAQLFELPAAASFAFYERRPGDEEPPWLVDPFAPVWRAIRHREGIDGQVRDVLARFGQVPFRMVNEAPVADAGLESAERTVCDTLSSGLATFEELRRATPLAEPIVDRLLYLLIVTKCIEPAGATPSLTPPPQPIASLPPPTPSMRPPSFLRLSAIPPPRASVPPPSTRSFPPPSSVPAAGAGPSDLGGAGIVARANAIELEEPFQVLGVVETASPEAVRTAYFGLSRLWHPDRLPAELVSYRPYAERILARLTAAHHTLADPDARRAWLASRPKKERPREEVLREIDHLLSKGDFVAAEQTATELVPEGDPERRAVSAWARARGGGAPEPIVRAALVDLDRAVNADNSCERAFFYRAMLHKRLGNIPLAFRDFVRVTHLDPRNLEAQREVRIMEMRSRKK